MYLIENDYGSEEFMDDEDYEDEGNCFNDFSHLQDNFISYLLKVLLTVKKATMK